MKDRLKNLDTEVKILLTFFLGYGIFYLIPQLFDFPITISYWLSELNRKVSFATNVIGVSWRLFEETNKQDQRPPLSLDYNRPSDFIFDQYHVVGDPYGDQT